MRPRQGQTVRADAKANRERIVRAARELFAEEGTEVSFNAIAHRAGVGNATLYRHFATPEELREAVFTARIRESCDLLSDLARLSDPPAELRGYLGWILETADLSLLGLVLLRRPYPPAVATEADRLNKLLDDLVARARNAGAIRGDVDRGALLVVVAALVHIGRNGAISDQRKAEFLNTMLRGLR